MILTAQQILATHKHRIESVSIGDGQEVLVRSLPSHVVDASQKATNSDAFVFVHSVVDENGQRLFKDEQVDEVADTVSSDLLALVASKAFALSVVPDARREEIKKNWLTLGVDLSGESPFRSVIPTRT